MKWKILVKINTVMNCAQLIDLCVLEASGAQQGKLPRCPWHKMAKVDLHIPWINQTFHLPPLPHMSVRLGPLRFLEPVCCLSRFLFSLFSCVYYIYVFFSYCLVMVFFRVFWFWIVSMFSVSLDLGWNMFWHRFSILFAPQPWTRGFLSLQKNLTAWIHPLSDYNFSSNEAWVVYSLIQKVPCFFPCN